MPPSSLYLISAVLWTVNHLLISHLALRAALALWILSYRRVGTHRQQQPTPTRTHANSGICSRTNTDTNSAPGKKASEPDAAEKQQQQQHQPGAKPRQTGAEDVFAGESSGYRPYENDCYARSRTNGTMNDGMTKVNHRWLKELRSRKWTFQGLKKEADEAKGGETTSSHQRH